MSKYVPIELSLSLDVYDNDVQHALVRRDVHVRNNTITGAGHRLKRRYTYCIILILTKCVLIVTLSVQSQITTLSFLSSLHVMYIRKVSFPLLGLC